MPKKPQSHNTDPLLLIPPSTPLSQIISTLPVVSFVPFPTKTPLTSLHSVPSNSKLNLTVKFKFQLQWSLVLYGLNATKSLYWLSPPPHGVSPSATPKIP